MYSVILIRLFGKQMPKIFAYDQKIAEEICLTISNTSLGLKPLCKKYPHWPCSTTIRKWIRDHAHFAGMYARAKLDQADYLVEQAIEISDDSSNDTLKRYGKDGNEYYVCNNEWIARSRLRVDTRKWLAAKLAPRVYSDIANKTVVADDAISAFRVDNETDE